MSGRIQLLKYVRFVSSVCPLYLRAVGAGGVTQGGDYQNQVDDGFEIATAGLVKPVPFTIPFYE
jgi:hypothetical protein